MLNGMEYGLNRESLVDEVLMLMPVLMRHFGGPSPAEKEEISRKGMPVDIHVSPGHIQILVALTQGPQSVGQLAKTVGVSPPAATQLVDKLVEHGWVERHHDEADRRVVRVDYVLGMHEVASRIMEGPRRRVQGAIDSLEDEEARAFVKGLKLMAAGFRPGHG
jgi:DNA-binding MarR family transcriptional regulator